MGDRITDEALRILLESGAGYLDLGGQLAPPTRYLETNAVIDALTSGDGRRDALAGKPGL